MVYLRLKGVYSGLNIIFSVQQPTIGKRIRGISYILRLPINITVQLAKGVMWFGGVSEALVSMVMILQALRDEARFWAVTQKRRRTPNHMPP